MKFLFIHNYYLHRAGEDASVCQERDLLASEGHRVVEYSRRSDEIHLNGIASRLRLGATSLWSRDTFRELTALIGRERPDVAHIHNTVPLISPSAYYACAEAGVPIVQTLHNYRLLCPAGSLLRNGQVCEECVDHSLFRSVRHACYRGSAAASATVALMLAIQRSVGTWRQTVNCYIARTEFARSKFIESGLPGQKIVVKPCFVDPDPGERHGNGETALFIGRLSPEKGLRTLLKAWTRLDGSIPLKIIGDGPLRIELESEIKKNGIQNVKMLGQVPESEKLGELKRARFLILPSEWYEGLPLTLVEAFACGVPTVVSRLGSMIEIVQDGRTGLHFSPGDSDDLARAAEWAWRNADAMVEMGAASRREYEEKYTRARNYELLSGIHRRVGKSSDLSDVCKIERA